MRLGGPNDGGYVCLNDFDEIVAALSLGTGADVSWDADIADRGKMVYQYDHTVEGPPISNVNFRFNRLKIDSGADGEGEHIDSILARNALTRPSSVIAKIDIEHDEWAVFAGASRVTLDVFAQIICEFHGFDQITDAEWFNRAFAVLDKLSEKFSVIHVHANNHAPLLAIGNLLFPEVLEVTFANRKRYTFVDTDELFPGPHDAPNLATRMDHNLGKFVYPV